MPLQRKGKHTAYLAEIDRISRKLSRRQSRSSKKKGTSSTKKRERELSKSGKNLQNSKQHTQLLVVKKRRPSKNAQATRSSTTPKIAATKTNVCSNNAILSEQKKLTEGRTVDSAVRIAGENHQQSETRRSKFHGSNCCPVFRLNVFLCRYRGVSEQDAGFITGYRPHEPRTVTRYVKGTVQSGIDYGRKLEQLGLRRSLLPAVAKHFGIEPLPSEQYEELLQGNDCPEPYFKVGQVCCGTNGDFMCTHYTKCFCKDTVGSRAVLVKIAPRHKTRK